MENKISSPDESRPLTKHNVNGWPQFRITWKNNGFVQVFTLVSHKCQFKSNYGYFTIYSPIYESIENGSLCLDIGYGKHPFEVELAYNGTQVYLVRD